MRTLQMRILIFVGTALALLVAASVQADEGRIYKYRDDQGQIIFTDDQNKIPQKYRDSGRVRQYRIISEPAPPPEEEDFSKKLEEILAEDDVEEDEGSEEESKGPQLHRKELELIQEALRFLKAENDRNENLIRQAKIDMVYGKYLAAPVMNGAEQKKALSEKLSKSSLKILKVASIMLDQSYKEDKKVKIGGEGYLEALQSLKVRMAKEIEDKKVIIQKLEEELDAASG